MASTGKIWTALLLGVALWANGGQAQTLPQTSQDALQQMAQLAGVIFTGQVVAVRQHGSVGGATGVVEIDFAVEDAVRGASGGSYTLREWAGLWAGGDVPFRVGQRYLMLLHSPGASGLSSPVGGTDGAIPIRGVQQVAEPEGARPRVVISGGTAGLMAATDGLVMDLSWVGTRVVNPISYQAASVARTTIRPAIGQTDALNAVPADAGGQQSALAMAQGAIVPIEGIPASATKSAPYTTVLGMLRSWEQGDHGPR